MGSTAKLCTRLIEINQRKGALSETYKESMLADMDLFLLNKRLTENEYNDLVALLNKGA